MRLTAFSVATALVLAHAPAPARAGHEPPPLQPGTKARYKALQQESVVVPTPAGEVYLRLVRPDTTNKVPVILTYTPYSLLYGDTVTTGLWVRRGYAVAVADVVGTGRSGGCWDYGGPREQASAYALVEWLGTADWSSGKVGMIGASYDGTTATMAAVANPPHLATIVSEVAISDWYSYAFGDGVRYATVDPAQAQSAVVDEQGADTPAFFDVAAMPEPRDRWYPGKGREIEHACPGTIDKLEHTLHGYGPDPVYDDFWRARNYTDRADALAARTESDPLEIPALVVGGWRDFNVKRSESVRWFDAIPVDDPLTQEDEGVPYKMLLMDDVGHTTPGEGFRYDTLLHAWFDRFLYDIPTNIEAQYPVMSRTNDGVIRGEHAWPPEGTQRVPLRLLPGGSLLGTTEVGAPSEETIVDTGASTEQEALRALAGESSIAVRWWVTEPVAAPVRIAGTPVLDVAARTDGIETHLTPVLFDLGPVAEKSPVCRFVPEQAACVISRGFLNVRNRNGLDRSELLVPGEPYRARVRLLDVDWVVPQGHRIGVALMASNAWWAVPDQTRARTTVLLDGAAPSLLELPVAGGAAAAVTAGLSRG